MANQRALMTASHGAACRLAGAEPLPPFDNSQAKWAEPTSLPGVSKRNFATTTCALCNWLNEKTQIKYLISKRVWRARKDSSDEETQVKLSSFGWGLWEIQGFEQCQSTRYTPYPRLPPERLYILHLKSCIKLL